VKLVMTLLVRDEADIVEANIAYHLAAGVDAIVVTDNASVDDTAAILKRWERTGRVTVIREPETNYRQYAWVTRMARLAASELDADWVLHNDADQFWWPEKHSLKQVFASIPEEYGVLTAPKLDFLPPAADAPVISWEEAMTVRRTIGSLAPGARRPPGTSIAIAHRADPDVTVGQGNHSLLDSPLRATPPWYPIVLLHFPNRTYDQFERKVRNGGAAYAQGAKDVPQRSGKHWKELYETWRAGRLEEAWQARVSDSTQLREGLARGELVADHRLQERLRELRSRDGFLTPDPAPPPAAPQLELVRELDAAAAAARERELERELHAATKELQRRDRELERLRLEQRRPRLRRAVARAVERLRTTSDR
jgi:hypothetical protein